jgi:hypothetical protein
MKITIDNQIIDTELIYSITEIHNSHQNIRPDAYGIGFVINFIGGQKVEINRQYYFNENFKVNPNDMVNSSPKYDDHGQFSGYETTLKHVVETIRKDLNLLEPITYTELCKIVCDMSEYVDEFGVYLFHSEAKKKIDNLRDKLIAYWEPDKTKIIQID